MSRTNRKGLRSLRKMAGRRYKSSKDVQAVILMSTSVLVNATKRVTQSNQKIMSRCVSHANKFVKKAERIHREVNHAFDKYEATFESMGHPNPQELPDVPDSGESRGTKLKEKRQDNGRQDNGRQDDGRQDDGRQGKKRQDDGRQDDGRQGKKRQGKKRQGKKRQGEVPRDKKRGDRERRDKKCRVNPSNQAPTQV